MALFQNRAQRAAGREWHTEKIAYRDRKGFAQRRLSPRLHERWMDDHDPFLSESGPFGGLRSVQSSMWRLEFLQDQIAAQVDPRRSRFAFTTRYILIPLWFLMLVVPLASLAIKAAMGVAE